MADRSKRGPAASAGAEHAGKKARAAQAAPVVVQVKQELVEQQKEQREEGEVMNLRVEGEEAAMVSMGAMTGLLIDVRMEVELMHCNACLLPLKPPAFECAAGHAVCGDCRGSHAQLCAGGGAYIRATLDALLAAGKVPCVYRRFGCESWMVYHKGREHALVCPCAPCSFPEPGCAFLGPSPALADHVGADHSRPATKIRYGRPWKLRLPLSHRWHALAGEEDRTLFLVSWTTAASPGGGAGTTVSLVCVRPDGGAAAPKFWCKMSAEPDRPEDKDKDLLSMMTSPVTSSTLSGEAPAPSRGKGWSMVLLVPEELVSGETLAVDVRIDRCACT